MKHLTRALAVLLCAAVVSGQETRATLQGTVRDADGAVLPRARVTATHKETNVATSVVTNDQGFYVISYVMPGSYTLSAQMPGFREFRQTGVTLAISSTSRIDFQLALGAIEEVLEVVAQAPLLQTTSASGTHALSKEQVESLPNSSDNAQHLLRFIPGMQYYGSPGISALHGNIAGSDISSSGQVGGAEFTLDGVPNQALNRRVAYSPATDTIAEISVETASFDASKGHTAAATISMLTKSGANDLRGSVQWGHWKTRWNGSPYTAIQTYFNALKAAEAAGDTAKADEVRQAQKQAPGRENTYSASLSGPILKDKLFFFGSYYGYQRSASETEQALGRFTVPAEAHRRGDFSNLLALGPQYQIYDPRTARLVNGVVTRDPFPNNQVPILNPLYQNYLKLYPTANNVPGVVGPDGGANYLATTMPWKWKYGSGTMRLDWAATPKHRFFAKGSLNDFIEDRSDWTFETARFLNSNGLSRVGTAGTVDWVYTLNSETVLKTAVAYNRFREGDHYQDIAFQSTPSSVGLPAYVDEHAADKALMPRLNFSAYSNAWDRPFATDSYYSVATLRSDLTRIVNTHTLRTGVDLRKSYRAGGGGGSWSSRFVVRNDHVRQTDTTSNAATRGLEWAAFMLGVPQSVAIDTNDDFYVTNPYAGLYLQDDWRVSSRLSLNLGIRYEMEGGFVERFDRAIGQFDPTAVLPVEGTMEQGYAALLPRLTPAQRANLPAQIDVRGGARYLNADGWPRALTDTQHNLMPRLGIVYQLRPTTILRAGYGWFFDTNNVLNEGIDQTGFNRATNTQVTNDRGLTFVNADLANGRTIFSDPFPVRQDGTRFNVPTGSSLGSMSRIGDNWDFAGRDWRRARQERWRVGVQHELTKNAVVEVAWMGARTNNIALIGNAKRLNPLPERFWASGNVRNDALAADLNTALPNPFSIASFEALRTTNPALYNDLAGRGLFTGTTIRKSQLLREWPHMGNVRDTRASIGENDYDHIEAVLTKRFAGGTSFGVWYARAWNQVRDYYANEFDTVPTWRVSDRTSPHTLVLNAVVDLPFGKGKRFFQNGVLGAVLGGWRVSPAFFYRSGRAYDFDVNRNIFWYGDTPANPLDGNDPAYRALKLDNPTRERWFNIEPLLLPSARAQFPDWATNPASLQRVVAATNAARPAEFHRRMMPSRFDFLRAESLKQLDMSLTRHFGVGGSRVLEVRADVNNLLNSSIWGNPNTNPFDANVGVVTSQFTQPRFIAVKARFTF